MSGSDSKSTSNFDALRDISESLMENHRKLHEIVRSVQTKAKVEKIRKDVQSKTKDDLDKVLGLLEEQRVIVDEVKSQVDGLSKDRLKKLEKQVEDLQRDRKKLSFTLDALSETYFDVASVRLATIETYRREARDRRRVTLKINQSIIDNAPRISHDGDPTADARLFDTFHRATGNIWLCGTSIDCDFQSQVLRETYIDIYGCSPEQFNHIHGSGKHHFLHEIIPYRGTIEMDSTLAEEDKEHFFTLVAMLQSHSGITASEDEEKWRIQEAHSGDAETIKVETDKLRKANSKLRDEMSELVESIKDEFDRLSRKSNKGYGWGRGRIEFR